MSPTQQLQTFTNSVYLVIKGRYFDDITGTDGTDLINQTIDWTNQFLDELETTVGPDGVLINWRFLRSLDYPLGTAVAGSNSIDAPTEILSLVASETRYVLVTVGGQIVSRWAVVDPNQLDNSTGDSMDDSCAMVGGSIVFSRTFSGVEGGGAITGDVTLSVPRLSTTNVKALSIIKPLQLLKLGVAKNATLPDIVQGGLSPSYVQKYNDLLAGAIARSTDSAGSVGARQENFTNISGVGF